MSTVYGADVAQLRELARSFDSCADRLEGGRSSLTGAIDASPWQGPDAQRFRGDWTGTHSRRMSGAVDALRTGARELRRNADEQERASAVDSGEVASTPGIRDGAAPNAEPHVTYVRTASGETVRIEQSVDDAQGTAGSTSEARSGLHGDLDAGVGTADGEYRAHASVHGEAGLATEESTTFAGGGVAGESGYGTFAGARGDLDAGASVGLDGIDGRVGAGVFAGSEVTAHGDVDLGAVGGGVEAGVRAGIGAEAHASAHIGPDEIRIEAKVGLALGVGISLKPSITIKPAAIVDAITSIRWPF